MMQADADLRGMVRELARMPAGDRAFVLDVLGEDAGARLAPLLLQMTEQSMSSELAGLVEDLTTQGTTSGIQPRAARAIVDAVEAARPHQDRRVVAKPSTGTDRGFLAILSDLLFRERMA